jgi:hypothetical protein
MSSLLSSVCDVCKLLVAIYSEGWGEYFPTAAKAFKGIKQIGMLGCSLWVKNDPVIHEWLYPKYVGGETLWAQFLSLTAMLITPSVLKYKMF